MYLGNLEFRPMRTAAYECPQCRRMTLENEVRTNHLVIQLLDAYHTAEAATINDKALTNSIFCYSGGPSSRARLGNAHAGRPLITSTQLQTMHFHITSMDSILDVNAHEISVAQILKLTKFITD